MAHRYELGKYRKYGAGTACHRKRMFVKHINTITGGYLSPNVGRDCGYFYTPSKSISTTTRRKKDSKATSRVKADIICRTTQRLPKG